MVAAFLTLMLVSTPKPYDASYVGCYDGDTCIFQVDLGFEVSINQKVRFCDIDTPEMRGGTELTKAKAAEVRDWLVNELMKAHNIVLMVAQKNGREVKTFDRILAWVIADGVELNARMVKLGLAEKSSKTCPN